MVQNNTYFSIFKQRPKRRVTYGTKQHIFKGFQTITKRHIFIKLYQPVIVVMYYTLANLVS